MGYDGKNENGKIKVKTKKTEAKKINEETKRGGNPK